jgi:diguanylate cyclase (GGDEF)-like protein
MVGKMKARLPSDEVDRLNTLKRYRILDTTPELRYDDLTLLASKICGTPIAAISLIDADRQWFKSILGLEVKQTSRDVAFCAHAILEANQLLVVEDATQDGRFYNNSLVTGTPGIRAYAGAPLVVAGGHAIGTLCAIDTNPRSCSTTEREALAALGRQVVAQLESHRQTAEASLLGARLKIATGAAKIGVWEWDLVTQSLIWDDQMYHLYNLAPTGLEEPYAVWASRLHPDDREQVEAAFNEALQGGPAFDTHFRIVLPSGEVRHLKTAAEMQHHSDGTARAMVGVNIDITESKVMEAQLTHAAWRDKLTGLANRALFIERLQMAVSRVRHAEQSQFAVLFLDFDHFKLVNDTLGHDAGDELLRQIAGRLKVALRASDIGIDDAYTNVVSRFGGDEFLLLLNDLKAPTDATRVAERLLNALAPAYDILGHEVHSSASIGIVTSAQCQATAEDVVRNADVAMYEAKRAGRSCSVLFNEAMHTRLTRHVTVESSLRRAIGTQEMHLVYLPIVELESGKMVSAEALVRWTHPVLGVVSPAEFIPIAEESGLIIALGQWVQKEAVAAMMKWQQQDPDIAPQTISVNVSRAELALGQQFLKQIQDLLNRSGLPPSCLQLEVTEREVMRNPEACQSLTQTLRTLGIKLAMDDFGTGTSSLALLRNFPFNTIKIDQAFMRDLTGRGDVLAVVHATINLIANLGMESLAEGVEERSQVATLLSLGCTYAQGYFFGRPVLADHLLPSTEALRRASA